MLDDYDDSFIDWDYSVKRQGYMFPVLIQIGCSIDTFLVLQRMLNLKSFLRPDLCSPLAGVKPYLSVILFINE